MLKSLWDLPVFHHYYQLTVVYYRFVRGRWSLVSKLKTFDLKDKLIMHTLIADLVKHPAVSEVIVLHYEKSEGRIKEKLFNGPAYHHGCPVR